jgi:hypothetical protein
MIQIIMNYFLFVVESGNIFIVIFINNKYNYKNQENIFLTEMFSNF